MITQFPVAQNEELLTSLLARAASQLGIRDNKVALEYLFGSRNIVPSSILQGHIWQLLNRVGHIWRVTPDQVIASHTLLPLFRPFVTEKAYALLSNDLIFSRRNPVALRSGINASILRWPAFYRVCPLCWHRQKSTLGFSYWQRVLQCPGVDCCPEHRCELFHTALPLQQTQRHQLVGAHGVEGIPIAAPAAHHKKIQLAQNISELLNYKGKIPNISQWSNVYQRLAHHEGLTYKSRIDHRKIREKFISFWGEDWLDRHGISVKESNNWLLAMFRSHRRQFTYLQHLACFLALHSNPVNFCEFIGTAASIPGINKIHKNHHNSAPESQKAEHRLLWRRILTEYSSLKEIRADKAGARIYSWLYRYDQDWLMANKPLKIKSNHPKKINWKCRDKSLVRALLKIEHATSEDLSTPRRSIAWFAKKAKASSAWDHHKDKLPLCSAFMARYAESVDEYQARRLAHVMADLVKSKRNGIEISEIERICGLSKARCRAAARSIIELHISAWQSYQEIPRERQA